MKGKRDTKAEDGAQGVSKGSKAEDHADSVEELGYSMLGSRIANVQSVANGEARRSVNIPLFDGIEQDSRTRSLVTIHETLPHHCEDDANRRTHSCVEPDGEDFKSIFSPSAQDLLMKEEPSGYLPMVGARPALGLSKVNRSLSEVSSLKRNSGLASRGRKSRLEKKESIRKRPSIQTGFRHQSLSAALSPKSAAEVAHFLVDKAVVKESWQSDSDAPKPYIKRLTTMRLDSTKDDNENLLKRTVSLGLRRRVAPVSSEDESSYNEINKQLAFHRSRVIKKTPSSYGERHKLSKEEENELEERRLSSYLLMAKENSKADDESCANEASSRGSSLTTATSVIRRVSKFGFSGARSSKIVPVKEASGSMDSLKSGLDEAHLQVENALDVPPWIVLPTNTYKMLWDAMMLVIVVYYIVTVPLIICFGGTEPSLLEEDPTLDMVLFLVFVADMISNFFIALEDPEATPPYIYDRKLIIKAYLKGWFLIDLVATFPISMIVSSTETDQSSLGDLNKILRLLRIFKLFRILRLARLLPRLEETTVLNPAILRLIKLFTSSLFLWHWIACGYWFVAEFEDYGKDGPMWVREGPNEWVPSPKIWCRDLSECNETAYAFMWDKVGFNPYTALEECFAIRECPSSFSKKYLHSFFWALMATVGVGDDIKPITFVEHLFSTVIIMIGIFMIATMISSASTALASLESAEMERRTRLHKIRAYLAKIEIKPDLKQRIMEYYDFAMTTSQNESYGSNQAHLRDLHHMLRMDLDVALHRHIVEKVPMLRALGQTSCLLKLIPKFKRITFIPGEYLVIQGEVCNEMHIIVSGAVKVIQTENGISKIVATLHDGESFGEIGLLFRQKQSCSVRASNYTDVLVLTKNHFDQVMVNFPELHSTVVRTAGFQLGKKGWNRVREALKVVRVCSMFGRGMQLHELLLGKDDLADEERKAALQEKNWRKLRGSITRLKSFKIDIKSDGKRKWKKLKTAVKITQAMASKRGKT